MQLALGPKVRHFVYQGDLPVFFDFFEHVSTLIIEGEQPAIGDVF